MGLALLVRTTNPVLASALQARLEGEGISCFEMDTHASIMDGSIGVLPRRLMVDEDDLPRAKQLLAELQNEAG